MPKHAFPHKVVYYKIDNSNKIIEFESKELPKMKNLFKQGKIKFVFKRTLKVRDLRKGEDQYHVTRDLIYNEKNDKFSWDYPERE